MLWVLASSRICGVLRDAIVVLNCGSVATFSLMNFGNIYADSPGMAAKFKLPVSVDLRPFMVAETVDTRFKISVASTLK